MNIAEQMSGVQAMASMGMGVEVGQASGQQRMDLIERIYAAAEDPTLWEGVLERVAAADETLRPHLERAVRLQRRMKSLEAEAVGLGAALDAAEQAVLCVDACGKVSVMNAVARRVLDAGEGLRMGQSGQLVCERTSDTAALRRLLAEQASAAARGAAAMKVQRSGGNGPSLNVTALPLGSHSVSEPGASPGAGRRRENGGAPAGRVLLFLGDPARVPKSRAEVMRSLYGLTPAEGRVCDGLLQGLETREMAERMRTTLETARFHMKQILRKTGAGRQSELVRLMMELPG